MKNWLKAIALTFGTIGAVLTLVLFCAKMGPVFTVILTALIFLARIIWSLKEDLDMNDELDRIMGKK